MSVSQAAESGTERELLVAMRRRIATAVDDPDTAARDLASLTKRLNEVVREIKAIDARGEEKGAKSGPASDEEWSAI
jgi:transposase